MPSRYLRPEIRTSRRWSACSWCAQSLYVRLITLVDDYGRYEADPVILCSEAFPTFRHFRPGKVTKLLAELHAKDLIRLYQHDGKTYLQILRWKERIRSTQSKFPAPPGVQNEQAAVPSACNQATSQTPLRTNAATTSVSPPPQPTPSPQPAPKNTYTPSGKRLHGIPASVEEVIACGQTLHPKVPEAQCRAFWAHYEGQAKTDPNGDIFWVTSSEAIVTNWKVKLPQFILLNQEHVRQPKPSGQQRVNRNIGTANEKSVDAYRQIGSVIPG